MFCGVHVDAQINHTTHYQHMRRQAVAETELESFADGMRKAKDIQCLMYVCIFSN